MLRLSNALAIANSHGQLTDGQHLFIPTSHALPPTLLSPTPTLLVLGPFSLTIKPLVAPHFSVEESIEDTWITETLLADACSALASKIPLFHVVLGPPKACKPLLEGLLLWIGSIRTLFVRPLVFLSSWTSHLPFYSYSFYPSLSPSYIVAPSSPSLSTRLLSCTYLQFSKIRFASDTTLLAIVTARVCCWQNRHHIRFSPLPPSIHIPRRIVVPTALAYINHFVWPRQSQAIETYLLF